ncbi:hypothetical protein Tsubulata_017405 [Turnera subulata]|uniref:Dof zinc finger protein n=1 Tax=Turnera subulata TaxID=218843 RepID=A0A9Q0JJ66_9ROSI|nr:hypothetical protein Tsubulata_017405 [Turnera subulata]
MGLSCKQVSSDGVDWSQTLLQAQTLQELPKPPASRRQQQQNQQQPEPLKCPRCESTNTKFCYYNNYNKSQPRHFCKTCKRHWTKGGTLRNVPVGGGRKNKRQKTSKANSKTITAAAAAAANTIPDVAAAACTNINSKIINRINPNMAFQGHHQQQNLLVPGDHQKNISDILYQAIVPPSSVLQQSSSVINSDNKNFSSNNNIVMFSDSRTPFTVPAQSQDLQFPYTSSSSFDTNPPAFESSNAYYNNTEEVMESSTITTIMPTSCSTITTQPWQVPSTSSAMDMGSYWNWDDIDTFVPTDLNIPWDDPEIKP